MRARSVLIAALFFAAGPLFAQSSTTGAPPKPAAHQPGVPAKSSAPATKPATAAPAASADKVDPAKEAAIRHLMDLTQTSKMGDNFSAYVTNQVGQALSQAMPPDRLAKLMESFSQKLATAAPPSAVTDAAIPIYARAFSMEDIQAITQFYESPLGQRMVKALPQVTRETEELGVKMQQQGAMNVLQEMSNDYPELKQMLKPEQEGDSEAAPAHEKTPTPASKPAPASPSN